MEGGAMILVTGGGGFIGLNVAHRLAEKGKEVLLVQRRPVEPPPYLSSFWGTKVKEARGSIMSLPFLISAVRSFNVESIVHAAFDSSGMDPRRGITATSGRSLNDFVQDAVIGGMNVLEVTRLFNLRRLTYTSSVDAYRGFPKDCEEWKEDALLPPVSFGLIGNTKKAMEQLCFLYSKEYNLSIISLRVGHCYGPSATHTFDPMFQSITAAAAGKPAELSHVPSNSRHHTIYVKDTGEATALLHLKDRLEHNIYNVTDGDHPTMGQCVDILKELIPSAKITLGPVREGAFPPTPPPNDRLVRETGFTPRNLRDGIGAYIAYLKDGTY
jgi:nucleoside-diphosphate-sugar epimerase